MVIINVLFFNFFKELKLKTKMFKDLIKFERKNIKFLLIGIFFAIITSFTVGSLPFLLIIVQEKLQEPVTDADITTGIYYIIGMVAIGLFGFLLSFITRWSLAQYACDQVSKIRMKLFNKISIMSPQVMSKYSNSSLNVRLSIDVDNYFRYFSFFCMDFIPALARIIIFIIMSIVINPILSLIYIPLLAIIFFVPTYVGKFSNKYYAQNTINNDIGNRIIEENVTGIRIVKSLNLKKRQMSRYSIINKKMLNAGFNADKYTIMWFPFVLYFIFVSFAFLLLASGAIANWHIHLGRYGDLSSGAIIAFSTYLFFVFFGMFEITLLKTRAHRAAPSIERIREIINLKETIISIKNLKFENGDIEFKNVSFKFGENSVENVLTKINLKIKKGTTVAIIGPTGSGKSILTKMISRGYDPTSGSININNKNIKNFNVSNLIKNISIIFQSKMLFSGTIRDNIEFGNDKLSIEEFNNVIEMSQAKEFIQSKNEGSDFILSQKGGNLSGGQQQRLSIARGLAKKSPILILDDSTSALDNITEKKVISSILNNDRQTIIIIAQRINAIKNIDKIVVLDKGVIQGVGNHHHLLNNCKTYQEICSSQGIKVGDIL